MPLLDQIDLFNNKLRKKKKIRLKQHKKELLQLKVPLLE